MSGAPSPSESPGSGADGPRRQRRNATLAVATVLGLVVGLGVYLFERVTVWLLDAVRDLPVGVMAAMPLLGLIGAAAVLRVGPTPRSRATADEYILSVHEPRRSLPGAQVVTRLAAAVATLGFGGSLGFEGPAVLLGAGVADGTGRRLLGRLRIDRQALLTAGAAAAVAAVFKAPATGAVFALEVPYRADLARHRLLPALLGAAGGYLAIAGLTGTEGLFPVSGSPPFDLLDLGGAVVLGVVAGLLARVVSRSVRWAKRFAAESRHVLRLPVAGGALAGAVLVAFALVDAPLGLGPGYDVLEWLGDPDLSLWILAAMLAVRFVGTIATTAGGGVGGFFIPLVVMGGLLGRLAEGVVGLSGLGLFPILGVAAVLGAGYQVPLAAVMFVAETSGQPAYVVPALLAAVAADLAVGNDSVTEYQRSRA